MGLIVENEQTHTNKVLENDFEQYKSKKKWPVQRYKWEKYVNDPVLSSVRKHFSQNLRHKRVPLKDGKIKAKCTLCSKGNYKYRQTSFMCETCEIPLCSHLFGMRQEDCFQLWHQCDDLIEEHRK